MTGSEAEATVEAVLKGTGVYNLDEESGPEALEAVLRRFAMVANGADPIRKATLRGAMARALKKAGVKAATKAVDAALKSPNGPQAAEDTAATGPGKRLALSDPELWPHPVDGADLLEELVRTFVRFAALPGGAATALALWVLHAYAHALAAVSPILALTSPSKRCGKTTVLHILGALVPRPLPASNITPAALFRAVEAFHPTLLVDEADTFLREREELRGVLNSGHAQGSAVVVRAVASGDDYEARAFSTWAPKAVALIDSGTTYPDTLRDRSIEVRMRRRAPGEHVERLRLDRLSDLEPIRQRCARWVTDHADRIEALDPEVPDELHDRARDNWRPLVALADVAGGPWPERARRAALVLSSGREDDEASAAVLLLADLRDLFERRNTDRLGSRDIVHALASLEDRPWPEWRRDNPITTRQLARLLRPFDVSPKTVRIGDSTPRGYLSEDLVEAWERYLPPETLPSEPQQAQQWRNGGTKSGSAIRNTTPDVADPESVEKPHESRDVADVADGGGGQRARGVPRRVGTPWPASSTRWAGEVTDDPRRPPRRHDGIRASARAEH